MGHRVAAFTDTYLPTVNGVTYTLKCWRERWNHDGTDTGGRMDVVFPRSDGYVPEEGEHPVGSLPFPFYEGFRLAAPRVPDRIDPRPSGSLLSSGSLLGSSTSLLGSSGSLPGSNSRSAGSNGTSPGTSPASDSGDGKHDLDPDVVHAHTPFSMGLSGLRLARRADVPFVASYHTPAGEYAGYLGPTPRIAAGVRGAAETYERLFFDRADVVVVPSEATRRHVRAQVGVGAPVEVVPNGVDLDRFRPVDPTEFRARHDLPDGPLVGYTGRHGHEKNLDELVAAADGLAATVVLAGDGPAREDLQRRAAEVDADVRFLGFLDREELPALYSALDVFAFPSPVETQGLVALEANACGTPVVGVDSGALANTVDRDVTGYRYPEGDVAAFREQIERALADRERLSENCLDRRESIGVDRSVDRLAAVYDELV